VDVGKLSQAEAEELPPFDPKTAEAGKLYRWDEMSDKRLVTAVRPTHVNRLGILADVYAWESGRWREVNAQELLLADGYGHYSMPEFIPMSPSYWAEDLELIADEYARAAAFLRSIAED